VHDFVDAFFLASFSSVFSLSLQTLPSPSLSLALSQENGISTNEHLRAIRMKVDWGDAGLYELRKGSGVLGMSAREMERGEGR